MRIVYKVPPLWARISLFHFSSLGPDETLMCFSGLELLEWVPQSLPHSLPKMSNIYLNVFLLNLDFVSVLTENTDFTCQDFKHLF